MSHLAEGQAILLKQRSRALLSNTQHVLKSCIPEAGAALVDGGHVSFMFDEAASPESRAVRELCANGVAAISPGTLHVNRSPIVIASVPNQFVPQVQHALEAAGRAITFTEPCRLVYLPANGEAALRRQALADGYTWCVKDGTVYQVSQCVPADVPRMLCQWKYASPAAVASVTLDVGCLPSVAVRTLQRWGSSCRRTLVAWSLVRSDGCMGLLHVMPGHRGRGLARRVLASLADRQLTARSECPQIAEGLPHTGDAPANQASELPDRAFAFLADYNVASQRLFESTGFVTSLDVTWVISSRMQLPTMQCSALTAKCSSSAPLAGLLPRAALRGAGGALSSAAWGVVFAAMNAGYREDDGCALDQMRLSWGDVCVMAGTIGRDSELLCLMPEGEGDEGVAGGMAPPHVPVWWLKKHASQFAPVAPSTALAGCLHVAGRVALPEDLPLGLQHIHSRCVVSC
jgi:GNAT superfamily N-acetyltransferase